MTPIKFVGSYKVMNVETQEFYMVLQDDILDSTTKRFNARYVLYTEYSEIGCKIHIKEYKEFMKEFSLCRI